MKMNSKLLFAIIMASVGSAACAADPTDRIRYYQESIQPKDSGVYENDGFLYVHVRLPLKNSASQMRVRMKAIGEMNDMLRKWAIAYACSNRVQGASCESGMAVVAKVLDNANPQWRYSDWKYQAKGQEFTGSNGGQFWMCQVVGKDVVIKQIPESFFVPVPPTNLVFKAVSTLLPVMMKADCGRLYSDLGTLDLHDFKITEESVSADKSRAGVAIEAYKTSNYYADVKRRYERLSTPDEVISWTCVPGTSAEQRSEDVRLVTNEVASATATTNSVDRGETDRECQVLGVSENRMVREDVREFDEAVIVETKTVTTVTTKRTIRRKIVKSIRGNPRFEEVFLSGGVGTNTLATQVASGAAAAKLYFSADATLDEREKAVHDALCENPGDIQMWNMYGRCLKKRGDNVGSLICFRAAAKLDKNDQFMLTNLAETYESLGCHRLACGYAILGVGLSKHEWCQKKCRDVLLK